MKRIGTFLWDALEHFLRLIIEKVLHINISEKRLTELLQFLKFGIVGLSNTIVSYVVYVIFLFFFQEKYLFPQYDYLVSQFIGFVISVLWSFYWNRRYVFNESKEQIPWFKALVKTYISYAFTGIFLNSILSIVWVQWIGISKMLAPIINLLVSVPLNFLLNKFWAFAK